MKRKGSLVFFIFLFLGIFLLNFSFACDSGFRQINGTCVDNRLNDSNYYCYARGTRSDDPNTCRLKMDLVSAAGIDPNLVVSVDVLFVGNEYALGRVWPDGASYLGTWETTCTSSSTGNSSASSYDICIKNTNDAFLKYYGLYESNYPSIRGNYNAISLGIKTIYHNALGSKNCGEYEHCLGSSFHNICGGICINPAALPINFGAPISRSCENGMDPTLCASYPTALAGSCGVNGVGWTYKDYALPAKNTTDSDFLRQVTGSVDCLDLVYEGIWGWGNHPSGAQIVGCPTSGYFDYCTSYVFNNKNDGTGDWLTMTFGIKNKQGDKNKTCASQGGVGMNSFNDRCYGGFIYSSDYNFCCRGSSRLLTTCSQINGSLCSNLQKCDGRITSTADSSKCCTTNVCVQKNCSDYEGGKVCSEEEVCAGSEIPYADARCCAGKCVKKQKKCSSCGECGTGGGLFEVCDRKECYNNCGNGNGNGKCGFKPNAIGFGGTCSQKVVAAVSSCGLLDNSDLLYTLDKSIDLSNTNSLVNDSGEEFAKNYRACLVMSGDGIALDLNGNNISGEYVNSGQDPSIDAAIVSSGDNQVIIDNSPPASGGNLMGFPAGIWIENTGQAFINNINTKNNSFAGIYVDAYQNKDFIYNIANFWSHDDGTGLYFSGYGDVDKLKVSLKNFSTNVDGNVVFGRAMSLAVDKANVWLPSQIYFDGETNLTILNSPLSENNYLTFELKNTFDSSNRPMSLLDAITLSYARGRFNFDANVSAYPELNVPTVLSTDKLSYASADIATIQLNRAMGNSQYYSILSLNNPFQMLLKGFDLCLNDNVCLSRGKICRDNRCVSS